MNCLPTETQISNDVTVESNVSLSLPVATWSLKQN